MTLIELKESLHKKIDNESDEHMLEQIAAIFDSKEDIFIIPEHMKEGIEKGLEDSRNGRIHTMEDFDQKYEKWLKG